MPAGIFAAKAMLHHWEEPCLSGSRGAGAVFFSGCSLGCSYCQNRAIRYGGRAVTPERLREILLELAARGAHCLDLVTPTHLTPWILPALEEPLPVPVVWNCGGYELVSTLRNLEGRVQIYLPDFKYADNALAAALSGAPDYFERTAEAIDEMVRQTGPYRMGEDGLLQSGVLIRHLLLPGQLENTRRVLDYLAHRFAAGEVLVSLMSQYTPPPGAAGAMARRVTGAEYRAAVGYLRALGLTDGYVQERSSAREEYTPLFDGSGL